MMKYLILAPIFALVLASSAQAACYADYKAKKGDPLQLHYGVIELPDSACTDKGKAARVTADRIGAGGWTLLNIVSTFGEDGLSKRQGSAGDFYLRY